MEYFYDTSHSFFSKIFCKAPQGIYSLQSIDRRDGCYKEFKCMLEELFQFITVVYDDSCLEESS